MINFDYSDPMLSNSILRANTDSDGADESAHIHGGTPVVNYWDLRTTRPKVIG